MIELRDVTVRYGSTVAVDDVSLDLPTGKIYGLLGRNGSGKTSLLSALASYRRPAAGTVRFDGADAFENPAVMRHTCFIRDTLDVSDSERVRAVLCVAGWMRPGWDADYAARLADMFELDPRKRVSALSRGRRSALGVVLGLASRAPLTILDETYLGMDAVARADFYRELLADYMVTKAGMGAAMHLSGSVPGRIGAALAGFHLVLGDVEADGLVRSEGVAGGRRRLPPIAEPRGEISYDRGVGALFERVFGGV